MNRIILNLPALQHNLQTISHWMDLRESAWTVVTKVLCGHEETLRALQILGVRSMGESRLENLEVIRRVVPEIETWFLRVPNLSEVEAVVALSDVSLNSELELIHLLNEEAAKQGKKHGVIIMIELGDLREGILPGTLVQFYKQVFTLPHIDVLGIGANLGCLVGSVPTVDQFMQLVLYRELLELKFERKLRMVSAGASSALPLALDNQLPKAANHFRIGEALFLGTDLIHGGTLPGLRSDTVVLEAEIVEIKRKSLVPLVETSNVAPFQFEGAQNPQELSPGQRGYRALVSVGHLDTDVTGLVPENPHHRIAGASSDIMVVNLGDEPGDYRVGDRLRFRLNYAAMLRLMGGKYVEKAVYPDLDKFRQQLDVDKGTEVAPVLDLVAE
ncbi:MAG: alanine racemase [Deltaproteobacteria bacterium]|nr:alanine racemase [Deltaproteobacteria bacterium]